MVPVTIATFSSKVSSARKSLALANASSQPMPVVFAATSQKTFLLTYTYSDPAIKKYDIVD